MSTDPTMKILSRLLDVSSFRQQIHAGNLANLNTPDFKAREVHFEEAFRAKLDEGSLKDALELSPEVVDSEGLSERNDGNNVSSEGEVMAMAQNKAMYDAYVQMLRGKNKMLDIASGAAP